jgi:hypothetical protein
VYKFPKCSVRGTDLDLKNPVATVLINEEPTKGYIERTFEKIFWLDEHVGECTVDWGLRETSIMEEQETVRPQWWDFANTKDAILFKLTWAGR